MSSSDRPFDALLADSIQRFGLSVPASSDSGKELGLWTLEDLERELQAKESKVFCFGRGEGYILYRNLDVAIEVMHLAVKQKGRGQGESMLKQFIDSEVPKKIWIEVSERNVGACCLYKKLGFIKVGARTDYYGPGHAAMLMEWCASRLPNTKL